MLIIISFELYWVHPTWNFREECSIHKSLVIYNQKIIKPGVINRRLHQIPKHAKKKNPSSSFLSIIILNFTFFKAINSSYQFNMCSVSELSIRLIDISPIYLFTYLKSVYVYFFAWYCDKISRFPPTPPPKNATQEKRVPGLNHVRQQGLKTVGKRRSKAAQSSCAAGFLHLIGLKPKALCHLFFQRFFSPQ